MRQVSCHHPSKVQSSCKCMHCLQLCTRPHEKFPVSKRVLQFWHQNVHLSIHLCTILGEGKCRWFPVSRISVPISNRDTMLLLYMYTQHTSMSELRNTIVSIIVNTYRIQGHSLTFLTPGLGKIYCQYYED